MSGFVKPSASPDEPEWFRSAIDARPQPVDVPVDGRSVRVYEWTAQGSRPTRSVLLIHGMGANAHWWDHIAPQLMSPDVQVLAVDLAGHGRSSHCDAYTMPRWSDDVLTVCAERAVGRPVLVGHSAGGRVAWTAAVSRGSQLRGVVLVDTALLDGTSRTAPLGPSRRPTSSRRVYPSREEIIERFRTLPPQRLVLPYVRRHIAESSIERVAGGWRWLHDERIYSRARSAELIPDVLDFPFVFLRCENGSTDPWIGELLRERLGEQTPVFEIPDAGHHVMLDQPLALVGMLRIVLDCLADGRAG